MCTCVFAYTARQGPHVTSLHSFEPLSPFALYMFQVQNLNNIMAFPLENVLKSELRDSRLVSRLHLIRNVSNTNKLLLKEK